MTVTNKTFYQVFAAQLKWILPGMISQASSPKQLYTINRIASLNSFFSADVFNSTLMHCACKY